MAAVLLADASIAAFGPAAWSGFIHFTSPAMSNVLLTGQPHEFSAGLISVFALARPLGLHPALLIQAAVTLSLIHIFDQALAWFKKQDRTLGG